MQPKQSQKKKGKMPVQPKKSGKRKPQRKEAELAPIARATTQRYVGKGSGRGVSWRIRNSELVGNVSGSTDFAFVKFSVNPGLPTFPWLSQEAVRWESYRFHRIAFRYVTRTATTTLGSVILSPEYNVRDAAPTNEQQATNTQDAVEDSPWKNIVCRLTPSSMFQSGPRKLIRSAMINGELNIYDAATLYVATIGMTTADMVGKLWVDYDVELFVPQTSPADSSSTSMATVANRAAVQIIAADTTALWVADNLIANRNTLGITYDGAGTFTVPAGVYKIDWRGNFAANIGHDTQVQVQLLRAGGSNNPITLSEIQLPSDAEIQVTGQVVVTGQFISPGATTLSFSIHNLNTGQQLNLIQNTSMLIITPL